MLLPLQQWVFMCGHVMRWFIGLTAWLSDNLMNTKNIFNLSDVLIFFFQLATTGFRINKLEMTVFEIGFSLENF